MRQVTAYRCDHCGKLFMRDCNCRKHEPQCTKNPLNRPLCYDCKFYHNAYEEIEEVVIISFDCMGSEHDMKKEFTPNKCTHEGYKLFSNIHMCEDTYNSLIEEGWNEMPTLKQGGCKYFEQREKN